MEKQRQEEGDLEMRCGNVQEPTRMSSCFLLALPTVCDSRLAGASAFVFTAAGQLRVCPHFTAGEHVSSSTGRAIYYICVSTISFLYYQGT